IGERHAVAVVQATSTLSLEDRAEVDRRVGPVLGRLGVGAAGRAARRVAAELDAASVVRRMEEAARSRRVTVRPAPDGMAYLTVLAPLRETVGAYAALRARANAVVGGQCPDEAPDGRGVGAVMADTAMQQMSGRAVGQVQPVEVHLVMTDTALLGPDAQARARASDSSLRSSTHEPMTSTDSVRTSTSLGMCAPSLAVQSSPGSVMEPARIPGHGSVPAPVARRWIREAADGSIWLRRLYTSPDGRDLVAMDSRRRVFTGLLRRMLVLRDDRCTTPWCDGIIAHADHTLPVRDGGTTDFEGGNGKCARCNYVKEAPGWRVRRHPPRPGSSGPRSDAAVGGPSVSADRHVASTTTEIEVTTPPDEATVSTTELEVTTHLRQTTASTSELEVTAEQGPVTGSRPGLGLMTPREHATGSTPLLEVTTRLRQTTASTSELEVTTPLGRRYRSRPPPLLGWGWQAEPQREEPREPVAPRSHERPAIDVVRAPVPADVGPLVDATGSTLERFLAALVPAA
ncbi:MAG TPA: hypothetical protein VFU25_03900, partial [Ornithinibacter sp.]|nr:hypothetical protein [Ornithinibacter sp.]